MMPDGPDGARPINCFALVTYISGPLGTFLDTLRRDLVPSCTPRAHVTILPPRPLAGPTSAAIQALDAGIADLACFEIETRSVEIFEDTSVIYIGLGAGKAELQRMHERLSTGPLAYCEPFPYHPHLTVAQDLQPDQVERLYEEAKRRWAEYTGPRTFPADNITFVQNTDRNRWLDLAHWSLGAVPSVR
jgi:2'-5' RNA ligase